MAFSSGFSTTGVWRIRAAWFMALVPLILSTWQNSQGRELILSVQPPARPALAFNQYAVDLGPVESATELRATFLFRNSGRHPVDIVSLTPSCGCLAPHCDEKHLEPGQTGRIVIRTQPANELAGQRVYTVDVAYTDPNPQRAQLTFRMELPSKRLSVQPRAIALYQWGQEPVSQNITVTDTRGRAFQILSVMVNSTIVEVAAGERRTTEGDIIEQIVKVTVPPGIPSGRHRALVTIMTDDPETPSLKVPLIIEGPPDLSAAGGATGPTSPTAPTAPNLSNPAPAASAHQNDRRTTAPTTTVTPGSNNQPSN